MEKYLNLEKLLILYLESNQNIRAMPHLVQVVWRIIRSCCSLYIFSKLFSFSAKRHIATLSTNHDPQNFVSSAAVIMAGQTAAGECWFAMKATTPISANSEILISPPPSGKAWARLLSGLWHLRHDTGLEAARLRRVLEFKVQIRFSAAGR